MSNGYFRSLSSTLERNHKAKNCQYQFLVLTQQCERGLLGTFYAFWFRGWQSCETAPRWDLVYEGV